MLKRIFTFVFVSFMGFLLAGSTNAQENTKQDTTFKILNDVDESVLNNYADLASELVEFGYKHNTAVSLVQAAVIFTACPKNSDLTTEKSNPATLLADAKAIAKDDKELLAYINSVEQRLAEKTANHPKTLTKTVTKSKTVLVAPGKTANITLYAETSFSQYKASVTGSGSRLTLSAKSSFLGGEDKGTVSGYSPSLYFWIGPAQDIILKVKNDGQKYNKCKVELISIIDGPEAAQGIYEIFDSL